MLARERQAKILQALGNAGSVAVADMATRLAVTDETIRRDLARLAEEGRLVRTHGGAVRPDPNGRDAPFAQRSVMNHEAKRAIAGEAARLIRPGDVLGLDASTTCFELARQLPLGQGDAPITVVTNGLDAAKMLAGRKGVRVISTGGEPDEEGASFIGPMAESAFEKFALTHAFLSCKGFDVDRGPSEASPAHAAIKQALLAMAEQSILLLDDTKFGVRSTCFVAPIDRFASLMTNEASRPAAEAVAGAKVVYC